MKTLVFPLAILSVTFFGFVAPARSDDTTKKLLMEQSGTFDCPAYKGKSDKGRPNEWGAYRLKQKYYDILGLDVLATEAVGDRAQEKTGPYSVEIHVFDGKIRPAPFFRNNTMYSVNSKSWVEGRFLKWSADYPKYMNNRGENEGPAHESGSTTVNAAGDLVSTSTYMGGEYVCKRVKE